MGESEEILRPAERREPDGDEYVVLVQCSNCQARYSARIPRGKRISDTRCESCGVVGDLKPQREP